MNIEQIYQLYIQHYLVDTDTRSIRENTIFFALQGANFNGNKFAEEALKKGAKYSVVDDLKYKTNDRIILVKNVLRTLQNLANYHRNQLSIPIIALTGSNGKTTTKELINIVLSTKYKTKATSGNLNNHIGVPLTLLSMKPNTELGIVEMGANHANEIGFLASIAEPDYGYITNFGKAHLEGFGSVEGVIKAKSELYDYLIKNNKTVFVNQQDAIQLEKTNNANRVFFDENIKFIEINPFVKIQYKANEIQSNLIGSYNYSNIAAAISIGQYFKISEENIKQAIENYISQNNRSQIVQTDTHRIILDAYNANPTSMKAALDNFKLLKDKNKIAFLGDMFELGKDSLKEHQEIVNYALKLGLKTVFIGENFFKTQSEFKFKTFNDFKEYLLNTPIKEEVILIKGSRGMALERCIDLIN
ncbi:UDP-N-acetylmuramoyl-tripeptide--D-alanyl-D-alanine ligase [Tenacibaculum sp. IB213877]|uniref:UDP-N-acetylmuramoyl-tripeptide--D-alanyl-D- alanine ligase n=1 Tax=Tenacibaculum sp. IB213877 TaxID=3097351 RepID=UPI002A5A8D56|nr:UDP-N-acetylmuramoyl-tripeptide--D-alanyl-D-alanine ligase [Tenacibaculum sp. IB213877]MDY0781387.1 UDP-N-acetylmuramoyl-tripeptide--D-alanyl-D-alanine ligase [Tenacibaculum sp. IB213877]